MSLTLQIFIALFVVGLILLGAEIFVPGGVLGTIGGLSLAVVMIMGFSLFGPTVGIYISLAILILAGVVFALWIKVFPKTSIGRQMTAQNDLHEAKGTEDGLESLLDKTGEALSDLRPAGYARIDNRRVDVVTQGGLIPKGTKVRVIDIEGNRVVVKELKSEQEGEA